jgi:hypothetical protein
MRAPAADTPNDQWWVDGVQLLPGPDGVCEVDVSKAALAKSIGFVPVTAGAMEQAILAAQAAKGMREAAADEARRSELGAKMIERAS